MPNTDPAKTEKHASAAARRLAHLAGLAAITHGAEQRILDGATERHATVQRELVQLRPRARQDLAAGDRYQALTLERGQLETVIAQAQSHLAPSTRDGTV